MAEKIEKLRSHPSPEREADEANRGRLQQHHADQTPIGNPDGFQRAKLSEIFNREQIKGLAGNDRADDQRNRNRDAKIYGNARVLEVISDAIPFKLLRRACSQTGLLLDSSA